MIIGPRYKIARRLGAHVFEKTQGQKFALSEAKRGKGVDRKHPKPRTDYGNQLLEKQRVRFTYGLNERQFSRYVKESAEKKGAKTVDTLYARLESRLDNVVYRLGFASTRAFARQVVSHGHMQINGKNMNIPSYQVALHDKITIRPASLKKPIFANIDEKLKGLSAPSWIKFNFEKKEAEIQGVPKLEKAESQLNLGAIIEFYSR